jgi:hypothetical protein
MKKIIVSLFLLTGTLCFSQDDSRFGVFAGVNQYYMKSTFLSSRSNMGFNIGSVATLPISEHSEFLVELSYTRFKTELLAKESLMATEQEWIKLNMDRFNLSVIYDYDVLHFLDEDIALGVNAGPSIAFIQDWRLDEGSKETYLIEPYAIEPAYLRTDTYTEKISFNAFIEFGISARYRNIEANFRYFKGITDPYRNFPLSSSMIELKGKDDYSTFTLTYYFGNNF